MPHWWQYALVFCTIEQLEREKVFMWNSFPLCGIIIEEVFFGGTNEKYIICGIGVRALY
jgi:hypothetical protein